MFLHYTAHSSEEYSSLLRAGFGERRQQPNTAHSPRPAGAQPAPRNGRACAPADGPRSPPPNWVVCEGILMSRVSVRPNRPTYQTRYRMTHDMRTAQGRQPRRMRPPCIIYPAPGRCRERPPYATCERDPHADCMRLIMYTFACGHPRKVRVRTRGGGWRVPRVPCEHCSTMPSTVTPPCARPFAFPAQSAEAATHPLEVKCVHPLSAQRSGSDPPLDGGPAWSTGVGVLERYRFSKRVT